MTNRKMLRNHRISLLLVIFCGVWAILTFSGSLCAASAATSDPSPPQASYSPFDEPRPRLPKEMLSDQRLDRKVKVFVKSKNFKELFEDLSRKTDVRISAGRELCGERAIIYFHSRALRDIMVEISALCGYHWLVSGKEGDYRYELFEDMRHASRRKQLAQVRKNAQDALLMDFMSQYFDDSERDALLARLSNVDQRAADTLRRTQGKGFHTLFPKLGQNFLRDVLSAGQASFTLNDLPLGIQDSIRDWLVEWRNRMSEELDTAGLTNSLPQWDPEDLGGITITLSRRAGTSGMPRLDYEVNTKGGVLIHSQWPTGLSENDLLVATSAELEKTAEIDEDLPDKPEITAEKLRRFSWHMTLLAGDVLEAIGRQSDLDVIADYHFRIGQIGPLKKVPLGKVITDMSRAFEYAYQFDGTTLRLRSKEWYKEELMEEPPSRLLDQLWTAIDQTGYADVHHILQMAALPDRQFKWPGFRFIPGADAAQRIPTTLRLWGSLTLAQEQLARSSEGLPIMQLSQQQSRLMERWISAMKLDTSADIAGAVIRIETRSMPMPGGMTLFSDGGSQGFGGMAMSNAGSSEDSGVVITEQFMLQLPDGRSFPVRLEIPGLSRAEREQLSAQRRTDAKSDVIELLE